MDNSKSQLVLVTGASRGIGLGIAKAFANNGDKVVLVGRQDKKQMQDAMETLACHGGYCTDLSDYIQAQALHAQVTAAYGSVDVLVNCAGIAYFGLFADMQEADWQHVLAHNLHTVIHMSHLVTPDMVRKRSGCIINISSVWGLTGASCEAVYAAAKGAVNIFTQSLAKELGPSGVRVNAIACGAFDTRMNDRLSPDEKSTFTEGIPLGRFGEPDEAGTLAVFLASPQASYLTGQIIRLDGGLV